MGRRRRRRTDQGWKRMESREGEGERKGRGGVISESTLAAATMDHTHRRIANEETGRDAEEGKKQVDRKKRNEREREGEAVGGERWKETKPSFARSLRRPFDRSLRASTLPSFLPPFLPLFLLSRRSIFDRFVQARANHYALSSRTPVTFYVFIPAPVCRLR